MSLFAAFRTRRRETRAALSLWGKPIDRPRDLVAIASAYACRPEAGTEEARARTRRTWKDLSLDAVFSHVDRCLTSAGQQALYRRLREPSHTEREIQELDRRVRAFRDDEALRDDSQRALLPFARNGSLALSPILYGNAPNAPRGATLFRLATLATVIAAAAAVAWPIAILALLGCVAGSIAIRLHVHAMMDTQGAALASLVDMLVSARALSAIESKALLPELHRLREALRPIDEYRGAISWVTMEPLRMNEIVATLITYVNVLFLLDVHAFVRSLNLLRQHGESLTTVFETVGEIDAARSIASFRDGATTSSPKFLPSRSPLTMKGMRHPLVENAIPNDVRLDASNGWLVTGSNMSGKSTFLRAIALNAWLAQSIGCVTARSYSAPLMKVRTLMHVEDDLLAGQSHFLVEARAAQDMLGERRDEIDHLCILDELFRGTNTVDRVAAASAFLRALNRNGAFVVTATHDAELIELLSETYLPHYFQETVANGELTFDYRLREGPVAPRNALAVLELVGFPADVLDDARSMVPLPSRLR